MLSVVEADRLIREAFAGLGLGGSETVPIAKSIGRRLAVAVTADRDQPPFDRVAMDGIAVVLGAERRFRIVGAIHAGEAVSPAAAGNPAAAVEVMTGAALPPPWNAVIPWEELTPPESVNGEVFRSLLPKTAPRLGLNIHRRASDYQLGDQLMAADTTITAAHIHSLATVGLAQVPVRALPRIHLVATGDELVAIETQPLAHQIRSSNTTAIEAYLRHHRLATVNSSQATDNREALSRTLNTALETSDIVLVSGGVSKGHKDYVPRVLEDLGCRQIFHQVAQKPGKPLWFGQGPRATLVFGLPGNPVSSLFAFRRYVATNLLSIGETWLALEDEVAPSPDFTHFFPCTLEEGRVKPARHGGSGNFWSIANSAGFFEVAAGTKRLDPGDLVRFYGW